MSEYSEDYGEVPAKDTADAMPENQDRPVSYGEDSDLSIEETPAESEESSESTDTRQRTERDLHARYGEMQGKYQALDQKIDGLIQQNNQMLSQSYQQQQASQPTDNQEAGVYNEMDSDQRKMADRLVKEHPSVKKLEDFKTQIEQQQYQNQVNGQYQHEEAVKGQQQQFYNAMEEVKSTYGQDIAVEVATDLYDMAELCQWNLQDDKFQKRLDRHVNGLEKKGSNRKQSRQRATTERGSSRTGSPTLGTALRKGPNGKKYYSWNAAAEMALEEARRNK
tara:strand:+ start:200 stop:1036 length:837 start_codon:yes stop_codon:yes gene_type:complete